MGKSDPGDDMTGVLINHIIIYKIIIIYFITLAQKVVVFCYI
jgi:hypothetical protein